MGSKTENMTYVGCSMGNKPYAGCSMGNMPYACYGMGNMICVCYHMGNMTSFDDSQESKNDSYYDLNMVSDYSSFCRENN